MPRADWSVGGVVAGGHEGIKLPVGPDPIDHHLVGERRNNGVVQSRLDQHERLTIHVCVYAKRDNTRQQLNER